MNIKTFSKFNENKVNNEIFDDKNLIYKKILSEIDLSNGQGTLRLFMSSDEKKACNEMIKLGYIIKGKSPEKNSTVSYYITKKGENYLELN
jgi:hypothetical protein